MPLIALNKKNKPLVIDNLFKLTYIYSSFLYNYSLMRDKTGRLKIIKELIQEHKVENQETLLSLLMERGIPSTQATLSRDLTYIMAVKTPDGRGGFYYSFPNQDGNAETEEDLVRDIHRGFISIEFSGTLGVLRTLPGHAHSVAFALDNLVIPQVLGTVAGDDTILLVLKESYTKQDFLAVFREKLPELEI